MPTCTGPRWNCESAHDLSDGGLAVALAESCFAGENFGAEIALPGHDPAEFALFGERGARALVSLPSDSLARLRAYAAQWNVGVYTTGTVTNGEFGILLSGRVLVRAPVSELRRCWAKSLEQAIRTR